MSPEVFLELAAYGCITTFSPGPNHILLLSSTSQYGLRKCRPLLLGIWSGLLTVMLLCGFALSNFVLFGGFNLGFAVAVFACICAST